MTKAKKKKSGKRTTNEDDFKRMAENLYSNLGSTIEDKESFDKAYDEYFQVKLIPARGKSKIKGKCWDAYHDEYLKDNLVIDDPRKPKKRGKAKKAKPVYNYNIVGRRRNKSTNRFQTVYAREIKTKVGLRYIDRRGRYVSVKLKK